MARVYADVNQNMPRAYWDYDSVNISASIHPIEPCHSSTDCRATALLALE